MQEDSLKDKPGEIIANKTGQIIELDPVWSSIEGLRPPLSDEAKRLIRDESVVTDAFIQNQFEGILADSLQRFLTAHPGGIGIRSILTCKTGTVDLTFPNTDTIYHVVDMQTILKQGIETPSDEINVGTQHEQTPEIAALDQHRVFQYLVNGTRDVLNTRNVTDRGNLLPAVVVYDLGHLEQVSGYKHKFKNPQSKSEALLAIYPLRILDEAK